MKTKTIFFLYFFLLSTFSLMAQTGGGIKRGEWNFRPEISTGNAVYWLPLMFAHTYFAFKMSTIDDEENQDASVIPWWFPQVGLSYTSMSEFQYADYKHYDLKVKEPIFDWTDPDVSLGYALDYTSKEIPLGFRVKLSYEHKTIKAKEKKSNEDWTKFTKDMVVPEVDLRMLFGNYRTSDLVTTVTLGTRYDYAFNANGLYKGKKTVNSGFSGVFGVELGKPELHMCIGTYVVLPFYDYFNKKYSPDGGMTYPYANAKTKLYNTLEAYLRFGF